MKGNRIFGFTAALLFVMFVTTGLWAQDLRFDGYINSGLGIVTNDNEDNDPFFKVFGVDSESNGFRFRLNGSYTNEAKNAGARFRFQGQRRLDQVGYLSMPYLYGWVGFFQNRLTFTGGLIDDGTWASADWWLGDDGGEGLGLLFKAEPLKGLIFGVGAYTISQQSGGSNNILLYSSATKDPVTGIYTYGNAATPNLNAITPKPEDVKYTFNLAYTMPDTFRFNAIFRTQNKAAWAKNRYNEDYDYSGQEESMLFQSEFRLLAVKNLTAIVVGRFDRLQDFDNSGNITISEALGGKIDNLNIGLNAVQFFYNRTDKVSGDKVEYNPSLLFNPWISYNVDKVVPRLDLVYFMGGRSKLSNGSNQWERRGFVNVDKAKDDDDSYSVFSIRPSIRFNLDSRTFFEIGDVINYDMAAKDGAYMTSGDINKKSLFSNVFYVDLKFSF